MGVRRANSGLLFVCDTFFTGCFYFITSLNLDDEALILWATCNCTDFFFFFFFETSWLVVVGPHEANPLLQPVYPLTVQGKEHTCCGYARSLEIRRGSKLKIIII